MIRTLAWKEYRDHATIWAALACLAVLATVGVDLLLEPAGYVPPDSDKLMALAALAAILACTYGLVCGAMMFAGEYEAGTLAFLDALTGRRSGVWRTKFWVGVLLTAAQAALLIALLVIMLHVNQGMNFPSVVWLVLLPLALEAYFWGLFFSARQPSVIAAAGLAAAMLVVLWLVTFLLGAVIGPFVVPVRLAADVVALRASWRTFCRDDLNRQGPRRGSSSGWTALLWLTWRQARGAALGLVLASLVLVLALPSAGEPAWPAVTFLAGIVCGTGTFAGDQVRGTYRFLGDQRVPAGRVWWMKTLVWLLAAALPAAVAGTALGLAASWETPSHPSMTTAGSVNFLPNSMVMPDLVLYHTVEYSPVLWLAYGFSVAQFFALAVRRGAAAAVLAILVGGAVIGLWLPSLVCGGVEAWQLLVPPAVLLATTRLATWPWMTDRLGGARQRLLLAGGFGLAAAWIAGSLWLRVAGVPVVGPPFDVRAFLASLPPEGEEAGRLTRRAATELKDHEQAVTDRLGHPRKPIHWKDDGTSPPAGIGGAAGPPPSAPGRMVPPGPGLPGGAPPGAAAPMAAGPSGVRMAGAPGAAEADGAVGTPTVFEFLGTYDEELEAILERGWPEDDPEVGRWLDEMFRGQWAADLKQAAALPPAIVEDPRSLTLSTSPEPLHLLARAGKLLAARSLQLQAKGKPAEALDPLLTALAVSRNLRRDAISLSYLTGLGVEAAALNALDRWQAGVGRRPELLRKALDELSRHEAQLPPYADSPKANYVVLRNTSDKFLGGLPPALASAATARGPGGELASQAAWVQFARQVPWERERWQRLYNLACFEEFRQANQGLSSRPTVALPGGEVDLSPYLLWSPGGRDFHLDWQGARLKVERSLRDVRLARMRLAVALFRLERGQPPGAVEELVPRYLPGVPLDPFTGGPLSVAEVSEDHGGRDSAVEPGAP